MSLCISVIMKPFVMMYMEIQTIIIISCIIIIHNAKLKHIPQTLVTSNKLKATFSVSCMIEKMCDYESGSTDINKQFGCHMFASWSVSLTTANLI